MPANRQLFMNVGPGLSMALGLPRISSWQSSSRPTTPKAGTIGFNTQTYNLEYFDGSSWMGAELQETKV